MVGKTANNYFSPKLVPGCLHNMDSILGTFLESVKCPNRPGLSDVNIWTENGADLENGKFLFSL